MADLPGSLASVVPQRPGGTSHDHRDPPPRSSHPRPCGALAAVLTTAALLGTGAQAHAAEEPGPDPAASGATASGTASGTTASTDVRCEVGTSEGAEQAPPAAVDAVTALFERIRAILGAQFGGPSAAPGDAAAVEGAASSDVVTSEESCRAGDGVSGAEATAGTGGDAAAAAPGLPAGATSSSAPGVEVDARSSGGGTATATSTVCDPECRTVTVTSPSGDR